MDIPWKQKLIQDSSWLEKGNKKEKKNICWSMSVVSSNGEMINLSFWENFIESIALVLSKGLTDKETGKERSNARGAKNSG